MEGQGALTSVCQVLHKEAHKVNLILRCAVLEACLLDGNTGAQEAGRSHPDRHLGSW